MTHIRAVALAMIWRDSEFLVTEYKAPDNGRYYYRPPGGGIQFGEYGIDAIRREMKEELNSDITDIKHLITVENLYTYAGTFFHEIALLYECRLQDMSLYERDTIYYTDEIDGVVINEYAVWKPPSFFITDGPPLAPVGLKEYLHNYAGPSSPQG